MMRKISILAVIGISWFFLASCSSNTDILSKDPSVFLDKKIESPFFGNKNAKVQMTVFTDFQCPACIRFEKIIGDQLFEEYAKAGKIGLEYRMYPLSIHKNAPDDALAALCAASEWKYKEFAKEMYGLEEQKRWDKVTPEERENIAQKAWLDTEKFQTCAKEGNYVSKIKEDMALGDQLWLQGTPSVYINGKYIDFNSKEGLFKIIDAIGQFETSTGTVAPKNQ